MDSSASRAEGSGHGLGDEESSPAPPARKFHRARSSLRMDMEEAAGLELENRQLRRRIVELEHALEANEERGAPSKADGGKSKAQARHLLQALQDSSEGSEEEELRAEKRMKEIVASGKWRKLADGMKRLVREQDMDDIEAENEELKECVLDLEQRLKQAKVEAHRLQLQVQDGLSVQNSYKDALLHAQQQVETAQMETDIQRRRVADLQEMIEQMELELSFAKMDTGPKPVQEVGKVATPETAECDGPRVGRLSVTEEAHHLAFQLMQGPSESSAVAPETIARAVRLIRQNLLMQRKLSGLLEWRSEVTVSKLQAEVDQEANLVQQLRARESKMAGKLNCTSEAGQDHETELEDLRLQCAELERQLQKDSDSARADEARLRAELQSEREEMQLLEDKSSSNVDEVQALEKSLAEAWRAVRQESQQAHDLQEPAVLPTRCLPCPSPCPAPPQSGAVELQQQFLAEQRRCDELEIACEKMSMAMAEAEASAAELREVEQEVSQQCRALKYEKTVVSEEIAAHISEQGTAAEKAAHRAESLEAKLQALAQENATLSVKCSEAEELCLRGPADRHQEAEDRQVQCDALEAGARNAERLQEELSLKAEELTSLLVDLHVAKKGQAIAEELAESLEKSVQGLRAEHSTCLAELSEAKHEAENLRQTSLQSRPSSLPLASLSPGECSPLGSTVAALRRARASLAAEAEKLPPSPSSPSSPSSASAGLKALQRLKAAAAGKPKSEEATDGAQTAASTPPGSKAMGSLVANRSKASSLWLKAAQATGDSEGKD